jgi:excisionase family DNA binding protein
MPQRSSTNRQSPASSVSSRATSTGTRNRPLTPLRTIEEAAELFNTSSRTVRRLIASGALPVHRIGRLVRISEQDIAVFLVANRAS